MSSVTSLPFHPRGRIVGRWGVAQERVHAYLACGRSRRARRRHPEPRRQARCAHSLDVDSTEEAIHVALEAARAELWGQTARSDRARTRADRCSPLEIRSQQLGSVIDWRRAAWRLRRLVVPPLVTPATRRPGVRAADLSRQRTLRRLCFTVLILSPRQLGHEHLPQGPEHGWPQHPGLRPRRRIRRPDALVVAVVLELDRGCHRHAGRIRHRAASTTVRSRATRSASASH